MEASLVKKLEELGIGRPSTYAPTISTIQKRGYVEKIEREGVERKFAVITLSNNEIETITKSEITGKDRNKLTPTDIGVVVTDFLCEHFSRIMDYQFTAKVEEEFDHIAQGLETWTDMIRSFYDPFHQNVTHTLETSERATGERELGIDPKTGKRVSARIGRFGPMIMLGGDEKEEGEKPSYASLKKDQSIQSITLEEALELFKLPRTIGEHEGEVVKANSGRFGLEIYNEGPGNLHITLGTATTSTTSYTVRLSSGDLFEMPVTYTGLVGGIFATAGTAYVTSLT
jgi:DNA topoisomerase-1